MNAKINITYRDKDGNIIVDPKEGDTAMSPETKKLYIYKDGQWEIVKGETNLGMTMYDINKQIIAQMPALDEVGLAKAFEVLDNFAKSLEQNYFMMLCRDINYYTLFKVNREPETTGDLLSFSAEVIDCALDLGVLKSIELTEDSSAVEMWVEFTKEEEPSDPAVIYLFPYDAGVIECTL